MMLRNELILKVQGKEKLICELDMYVDIESFHNINH